MEKYELAQVGLGMFGIVSHSIKKSDNKEELEEYCTNTLKKPLTPIEDVFIKSDQYPFFVIKDTSLKLNDNKPFVLPIVV